MRAPKQRKPAVRVLDDPELLELFEDEPELLAITDALQATRRAARPRASPALLAGGAAAAVAAIVVVALAVTGNGGPSLVERAAAAVRNFQVVHASLEARAPTAAVVDLRTGRSRAVTIRIEAWLDSSSGRLRVVTRRNGTVVADAAGSADEVAPAASGLDPGALTFLRDYRAALVGGRASELPGRRVRIAGNGGTADVALDDAARPAAVESSTGPTWRVAAFSAATPSPERFTPSPSAGGPGRGRVASTSPLAPAAARGEVASLLGVGVPERIEGLPLVRARSQTLTGSGGTSPGTTSGVELTYAGKSGSVQIRLGAAPEPAYGFAEGRFTFQFDPIPPRGELDLAALGGKAWIGQLRVGRGYATIRSSTRGLVVSAARLLLRG